MARRTGDDHPTRRRLAAGLPAGNLGGDMGATTEERQERLKFIPASTVLARMRRGDLPTPRGAGGFTACFADGALVRPQTMRKLEQAGKIERPQGGSMARPYTLTAAGADKSRPLDGWRSWPVTARKVVPVEGGAAAGGGGMMEDGAKAQADGWAKSWNQCSNPTYVARVFKRVVKAGGVGCTVFVVVCRRKPEA